MTYINYGSYCNQTYGLTMPAFYDRRCHGLQADSHVRKFKLHRRLRQSTIAYQAVCDHVVEMGWVKK